jgi:hypothetical protein
MGTAEVIGPPHERKSNSCAPCAPMHVKIESLATRGGSAAPRRTLEHCGGARPFGLPTLLILAPLLMLIAIGGARAYDLLAESVTISGRVVDDGARGVSGVLVELIPAVPSGDRQTVTTGADGTYSAKVQKGWTGRVRPKPTACAVYSPESKSYANLGVDQPNQNYQAGFKTVVISGRVADSAGKGIPGVVIGGLTAFTGTTYVTVVTGPDGSYRQRVLCGFSHPEIKPVKPNHVFRPVSRSYSGVSTDLVNQDYQGSQRAP